MYFQRKFFVNLSGLVPSWPIFFSATKTPRHKVSQRSLRFHFGYLTNDSAILKSLLRRPEWSGLPASC